MVKTGAILLVLGAGALVGYGLYTMLCLLYTSKDAPLVIQIAVPVALLGLTLIVATVIRDRVKTRSIENFEEVRH